MQAIPRLALLACGVRPRLKLVGITVPLLKSGDEFEKNIDCKLLKYCNVNSTFLFLEVM